LLIGKPAFSNGDVVCLDAGIGAKMIRRPCISYAGASLCVAGYWQAMFRLDQSDGCGTRPFFALPDLVLHLLTFPEFLHGHSLYFGVVEEHLIPLPFDKPETSIRNQLLDRTLWHCCPPTKQNVKRGHRELLLAKQTIGPKTWEQK
jgi:hypothetical protein